MPKWYWFEDGGRVRATPTLGVDAKDARARLRRPSSDRASIVRSRPVSPDEMRRFVRKGRWFPGDPKKGDPRGKGF